MGVNLGTIERQEFAASVAGSDLVTVVGGKTQWDVGGTIDPNARAVSAPVGIYDYTPSEMTLRCGAGTTVGEIQDILGEHAQMLPVNAERGSTIGGILAVGRSGIRRLRYGAVRDYLLESWHADHEGKLVKSGGPTIKNVSGYDLCRLLVGSLGTLGFLAEVTVRSLPSPPCSRWMTGVCDPFDLQSKLYRPSCILWNGNQVWVLLEGHPVDVEREASITGLSECSGPPVLPSAGRLSLRPKLLRALPQMYKQDWLAEIGVGLVHLSETINNDQSSLSAVTVMRDIKTRLDPTGRLNPGREVF